MAVHREGQRGRVLAPPAPAAVQMVMRRGRDRERTDFPEILMLLGASVVVGFVSAGVVTSSSTASGDCVLAGFLLWLLGVVLLSFHRAQRLRRFFGGHLPRRRRFF